jgi:HSP20 family protein
MNGTRRNSMSIATRSMLRELETLRNRIDRMFSDDELAGEARSEGAMAPALDVQETDDEIVVKASMPGIKPEDVEVKLDRDVIKIRGTCREERDEEKGTWHVHERRFGTMYRSFTLPAPVDEERAEATMKDGVLEIHLPKSDVTPGKQITVKSS